MGQRLPRLGTAAMALALLVQTCLPFAPMPSTGGEATGLYQAASDWDIGNLCLAPGERPGTAGGKHDLSAGHECPFCQLTQQVAGMLPPSPLPGLWSLPLPQHATFAVRLEAPARFVISASHSRAPPLAI